MNICDRHNLAFMDGSECAVCARQRRQAASRNAPKCTECNNQASFGYTTCSRCRERLDAEQVVKSEYDAATAFFAQYGEYRVHVGFYECTGAFDVEELYQHFKARLRGET